MTALETDSSRIYKYDNIKAILIFLVVIGHMTTAYASDDRIVRWITLWIYTFHMPAFIFISGLMHKRYVADGQVAASIRQVKGETHLRTDKILGFILCAYVLKAFIFFTKVMVGLEPHWKWIDEPSIPWYLVVMAEYEILFYLMRKIDKKVKPWIVIAVCFAASAIVGYFPAADDTLCLARMINFQPIYAIGYYMDMRVALKWFSKKWTFRAGVAIMIASVLICKFGGWNLYRWRKWFTGRRSYDFLQDLFTNAIQDGWWIRILVWSVSLILTFAFISIVPNKNLGLLTEIGSRTLQVYFWHRPVCYLLQNPLQLLQKLVVLFGGTYDPSVAGEISGHAFGGGSIPMILSLLVYFSIGIGITLLFSSKIFENSTTAFMILGKKITEKFSPKKQKSQVRKKELKIGHKTYKSFSKY